MKKTFLLKTMFLLCALVTWGNAWAQSDKSTDYTGNITLSTTGGSSASTCVVKIGTENYNGIKAGTSSKVGAIKIAVPAGTKYLHLHAAGWSTETVTLSVTPDGYSSNISLTSNSGIASNSPFTFSGDPSTSSYYKVITFTTALASNTDLTFTASSGKRFVIWGVTSEEDGETPSLETNDLALTGAPIALNFDLYNNSTAQVINYTTSSTGTVSVVQNEYIDAVVNESAKTITVTPLKKTSSAQTITVNQAADETYDAGSKTFTVSISDSKPYDGGDVTFDATSDTGTSPLVKEYVTFSCTNCVLNNSTEYRLYKNSTTTFTLDDAIASEGFVISSIAFTCPSGNPASGFASQDGWATNGDNGTWTGASTSVSFSASGAQVRATKIVVTIEKNVPKVLASIALSGDYPTSFYVGDSFSNSGMTVTATYDNASTKNVTANATFSGYDMSSEGVQEVTVSYTENEITKTAKYNITVNPLPVLTSIAFSGTYPTTFLEGDEFSHDGMIVTATFDDDTQSDVTTEATFSGYNMNEVGEQTVTVSYTIRGVEKTKTYNITVNAIPVKTIAEFIAAGGGKCYLIGTISNDANNKYGNFDLTDASGTIYVYGTLTSAGVSQQYLTMGIGDGDMIKVLAEDYLYYQGTTHEAKNVRFICKYESIPVSAAGWATYCSEYALDFTGVTELTAYTATKEGDAVKFNKVTGKVPANTGLLVSGTTANVPVAASADAVTNILEGVTAETVKTAGEVFVLKQGTNGLGFYKNTNDFTVRANSAYLPATAVTGARAFIALDDEATGIEDLTPALSKGEGVVYDLSGRRVVTPTKGLYIVNGKKVIVK